MPGTNNKVGVKRNKCHNSSHFNTSNHGDSNTLSRYSKDGNNEDNKDNRVSQVNQYSRLNLLRQTVGIHHSRNSHSNRPRSKVGANQFSQCNPASNSSHPGLRMGMIILLGTVSL